MRPHFEYSAYRIDEPIHLSIRSESVQVLAIGRVINSARLLVRRSLLYTVNLLPFADILPYACIVSLHSGCLKPLAATMRNKTTAP